MSVIQKIRDKYSRIAVIAIAVALLGFILIDYISGRSRGLFSGGNSNSVGSINGNKIDALDFEKKVQQQEDYIKQQPNAQPAEAVRQQAINATWEGEINRILMTEEIDKLGMQIGKKEINDMLFGANPPEDLKKQFTDPQTGQYKAAEAQQAINAMKKSKQPAAVAQKENFNNYLVQLEYGRMVDKYNSLLSNSVNSPRWLLEKRNADNSQLGKISMVREVYSSIPDSAIKISDKEIADFISKQKDDYKQEESRSIAYVTFSALPSAEDTAAAKKEITLLKSEFDTTHEVATFLARNGITNFFDGYIGKSQMKIVAKDTIQKLPKDAVFGPYLDGGSFVLAKLLEVKELPDSVKCRHILIGTKNPQTGQPTIDDSAAHKIADSIALAIRNGANFDSLETKFSTDQVAHKDKGVMTFSSTDIQGNNFAKEFGKFILFDGKPGDKKDVKTDFGWHYIEILSFINPEPHYKVAYLDKQIVASTETDQNASNQANLFAGDSRDRKSFDANFEKNLKPKGFVKGIATDISPIAFDIRGLGTSRTFVKDIYKASLGEVLQSKETVADHYVVAAVTEINKEGTQSVAKARISIEPFLRNKKKAEQIKQKVGKVTTLEAAATALGKQIEIADSIRMFTGSASSKTFGYEPRVNGAIFNPNNKGKLVPEALEGMNGVYIIRVDNVTATAMANANVEEQRKAMYQQARQSLAQAAMFGQPPPMLTALRNAATIKDKRSDRY